MFKNLDVDNKMSYIINIQILDFNPENKKYHDGLETFIQQEIDTVCNTIDCNGKSWNEIKNITAIRLMDIRDEYYLLKDQKLNWKYYCSLGLNIAIGGYFFIKYIAKFS